MISNRLFKEVIAVSAIILIIFFSLTACSSKMYWAKPGAKPGDFDRDVVECRKTLAGANGGGVSLNPAYGIPQSAIDQCLGQKGWYLAEKPPDVEPVDPPG